MDDNNDNSQKVLSELVKAMSQIQAELQQMNKTLSAIASQGRASSGGEAPSRYPSSRPTGYAGRTGAGARPTRFKRADGGESTEGSSDQGFRSPRKSPGRPKSGKPPSKKSGGGYPKKPR